MNLKFGSLLLGMLCLIVSCSDDNILHSDDPSSGVYNGSLFLSLNLSDASQYGSRTDYKYETYDDFEYENTILKGSVYVFEGSGEADAKCVTYGEVPLDGDYKASFSSGSFASNWIPFRNIRLKDFEYDSSKTYFALVVLNANDEFKFPDVNANETFSVWAKKVQTGNMLIKRGEYNHPNHKVNGNPKTYPAYFPTMTNASGQVGFTGTVKTFKPVTLVKIDNSDFSLTEKTTADKATTKVYVQRNVARVLLQPELENNGNALNYEKKEVIIGNQDKDNKGEYWAAEVNISNWCLDIVNNKSYGVMNIDGIGWHIRINSSGQEYMHTGNENFERCLWAKDPNYDNPKPSNDSFTNAALDYPESSTSWTDARVPRYCLENTFNTKCMLQGQTTRIVMKGKWSYADRADEKDGGGLLGSLKETDPCYISIDQPNSGNPDDKNGARVGFYLTPDRNKLWCRHHIEEALEAKVKEVYGEKFTINPTWERKFQGGYFPLKDLFVSFKITDKANASESDYVDIKNDPKFNIIATALGLKDASTDLVSYYFNCFMFYALRIPHFNESDVPWDPDTQVKESNGNLLADYNENHLGRYGVVRNYSYIVSVKGIHSIGEPTIPPYNPDDTDDMPSAKYLDVDIKVQSWTKHDISVSF